jgi:hypothetical protein
MPPTTVPSRDFEPRAASHSADTMQNRTEMPIFLNSLFATLLSTLVLHISITSGAPLGPSPHSAQPLLVCKKISLMKRDLFFVVCAKRQMTRE